MQSRDSSNVKVQAAVVRQPSAAPQDLEQRFHLRASIAGRYIIERPLSQGAMSMVVSARDVSLDELVAIKFLRPELRDDTSVVRRFAHEARALARIANEHVVRVIEVGTEPCIGPYMVMEYLDGMDLSRRLEAGPLPQASAVEYILQACEALAVAHAAGIVHRDLKPENLFLARRGALESIKVLDFGISHDGTLACASNDDPVIGTPPYMSPERVLDDPKSDHRCDIWSLGITLHELVTGRVPFEGLSDIEICTRIARGAPPALAADERVLSKALRTIIARCLQRHPDQRYQCVEELVAALVPHATLQAHLRARFTGSFPVSTVSASSSSAMASLAVSSPACASRGLAFGSSLARTRSALTHAWHGALVWGTGLPGRCQALLASSRRLAWRAFSALLSRSRRRE